MARHGRRRRSRSPRGHLGIAKAVAAFARYTDGRPPGLIVSEDGCMLLDNLGRSWGDRHGLTANQILEAVRAHIFHKDGNGMRFAVDGDAWGHYVVIRVFPRRAQADSVAQAIEIEEEGGGAGEGRMADSDSDDISDTAEALVFWGDGPPEGVLLREPDAAREQA